MAKNFKDAAARKQEPYSTLMGYTEEELKALTAQKEPDVQEVHKRQEALATQGKRGAKAQRINMAFTPSNIDFIRIMAKLKGQTMTQFVNEILDRERENAGETYQKAKELIDSL